MKTLYLLRHGKSSWKDRLLDDFERPLAGRGRAAAAAMGRYLAEHGMAPAQVLCSSARRTRETWQQMHTTFDASIPTRFEKGIYLADAPVLLRRLKRLNDALSAAMIVGHNPGLERLAEMLIAAGPEDERRRMAEKFPTGALAVVQADVERWADLRPGCARLERFVRPKDLKVGA
jgi:phosphohistidine phosphatase